MTDGLLASCPKDQEAGLDLAASIVRDNAELAALMLQRNNTSLSALLGFVRHRSLYANRHKMPFSSVPHGSSQDSRILTMSYLILTYFVK